jgi:response regulator of citrate/malate metabolism
MTLHKVETKGLVIERKRKTSEDLVVNYFIDNPTASVDEAAKDLSLSRTTINRYKPVGEFSES